MEELSTSKQRGSSEMRSALLVILGSSLISISPFFVEFSGLDAAVNTFYRLALGGVVLFFIALWKKEPFPKGSYFGLTLLAALCISLDLVTWNRSVLYIGSGLSTILANLEVIFLVLIGTLFFKEKLPRSFFGMLALIALGVIFLIYPYLFTVRLESTLGILFALSASAIYSVYLLLIKTIQVDETKGSATSTLALICLLGAVPLGIYIGYSPSASFYIPNAKSFFCLAVNGLLIQVFAWLMITKGMRGISLSLSGVLMISQPALTFIMDCLFLGRNVQWIQLSGCAILLFAIYRTAREEEKGEVLS